MNIFEIQENKWWEYMEPVMRNVNLNEILIQQNNHMIFTFSNSYNGKICKKLSCNQILKCCIENEALESDVFAYFIPDVYKRMLSKAELESALIYYRYGHNVDITKLNNQYLILIIGSDIYIDIICGEVEVFAV